MANHHQDTPWTFERVEDLRRLWAEGYTASQIADELGGGFGRCAVLGKVNRLGLVRRKQAAPRKPKEKTVARGRPILRRPMFKQEAAVNLEAPPLSPPRMRR